MDSYSSVITCGNVHLKRSYWDPFSIDASIEFCDHRGNRSRNLLVLLNCCNFLLFFVRIVNLYGGSVFYYRWG